MSENLQILFEKIKKNIRMLKRQRFWKDFITKSKHFMKTENKANKTPDLGKTICISKSIRAIKLIKLMWCIKHTHMFILVTIANQL